MEKSDAQEPESTVSVAFVAKAVGAEGDEAPAASSKPLWCEFPRPLLPLTYREELYCVLRLAAPLLLSRILNFLQPFVIAIFCGRIGNTELAGYALASATINVTTISTGYGLALACDTLISQTYGGKNMKRVGTILQRSVVILLLFCLPCWALLINCHSFLLVMQQEAKVARIAQIYAVAFLPAVPAMFLHQLQVAYLQNQGIILPQMYTAAVANLINLGVNYLLIFSLKLGVIGSAIANSLSQITICVLLFGYIRWKNLHKKTWGGWSTECLQEWGSYMQLAIPSMLMLCFEWWVWDIGGVISGLLGEVDLAAQHVLNEIGIITYMFPLGVHAAACVRVGNALGAGNTARAITTCKVTLGLSALMAVFQGMVIAGSKSVLGYIFTSDENIVAIVSEVLTLYTFLQFFDALLCVCSGILVGSGMQKIAALSNLVLHYCIGLPLAVVLMFTAEMRILGLWLGLFTSAVLQAGLFLIVIYKLNWQKLTHMAQVRSRKTVMVIPKRPAGQPMDTIVPDVSDGAKTDWGAGDEAATKAGYCPVSVLEQQGLQRGERPGEGGGDRSGGDTEAEADGVKPNAPLSDTQLILRRGLTLLTMVLILALGMAVHFAFPPPEPPAEMGRNSTSAEVNIPSPMPTTSVDITGYY